MNPMSGMDWAQKWGRMDDRDLEHAAHYYFWLASTYPELHSDRLEEIVAEATRRGKPEIVENAKASVKRGGVGPELGE